MGILKNIIKRFSCKSKCAFNTEDFDQDLKRIDLTKYQLKVSDLMAITKIIKKRPSIYTYTHDKNDNMEITEI